MTSPAIAAAPGTILVLNGAPRSGKSSIAAAIQATFDGPWMALGVDVFVRHVTPERYRPGIGLRPGGERADLEPLIPVFYAAMYESIAAHSRLGLNVVADVGHHESYTRPLDVLADCARRLAGLPAWLIGVRCSLDRILDRRAAAGPPYLTAKAGEPVPQPILRWQADVHLPGIYDLEVDTGRLDPTEAVAAIRRRIDDLARPPEAFRRLAAGVGAK